MALCAYWYMVCQGTWLDLGQCEKSAKVWTGCLRVAKSAIQLNHYGAVLPARPPSLLSSFHPFSYFTDACCLKEIDRDLTRLLLGKEPYCQA